MSTKWVAAACAVAFNVVCAHAEAPAPIRYHIVDRIAGRDGGWNFANVDPANGRLYVARSDAVERIDLSSRKVIDALSPAHRGHQVLVLEDGATLFETDGDSGLGRFISSESGKVLAEVATGAKPDAAFFDPATGLIAVMNAGDGTVALVDPKARKVIRKIAIGGGLEFGVADGKGGGFINLEDAGAIARVDLKSARRTGTIALPRCEGPTGLALVANGTRLITACANRIALVIDAASGKTLATLPIGGDPDAVLVDAARGLAFIPCGGTGTLIALSITDPNGITIAGVIPTQRGAKTGAIDPRDGRIYLPTATLAAAAPGAKRGQPIPGTFTVLVLAPEKKGDKSLQYLDAAALEPARTLPAPAPRGSPMEAIELHRIHSLIDQADEARRAQAKADADLEDPSIFDAVTGRKLETMPNTWALLLLVQSETDRAVDADKIFFARTRPWGVDASLHACEDTTGKKPTRGYPSGHAGLGYSVGWTLAQLIPTRAPAILDRAKDYGISREICGEHFGFDTEASHVFGTLTAWTLYHDPRLAGLIEAARAELSKSSNP